MQRRVRAKLGAAGPEVEIIANWPDVVAVDDAVNERPDRQRLPLVAQYSGKMGVTHDPDILVAAAAGLQQQDSTIRFDVFAWGGQFDRFRQLVKKTGLQNIRIGHPCKRELLPAQLADCDIGLILMRPGALGASVPCRLYNLLAAGKPVIAAVEAESEVAMVIREARVGWVIEPEDAEGLVRALSEAAADRAELAAMGARAKKMVQAEYSFDQALNAYSRAIAQTMAVPA
jgi:glycosyltransferase involved in cell wall biosynthesis